MSNVITLRTPYKTKEYHFQPCKQANGMNFPFVKKVRYGADGESEMILSEAERNNNCHTHIKDVCHGKRKSAGGYGWKFIT